MQMEGLFVFADICGTRAGVFSFPSRPLPPSIFSGGIIQAITTAIRPHWLLFFIFIRKMIVMRIVLNQYLVSSIYFKLDIDLFVSAVRQSVCILCNFNSFNLVQSWKFGS